MPDPRSLGEQLFASLYSGPERLAQYGDGKRSLWQCLPAKRREQYENAALAIREANPCPDVPPPVASTESP